IAATGGSSTIEVTGQTGCRFTAYANQLGEAVMSWSIAPASPVPATTPLSATTPSQINVSFPANTTTQNTGGQWRATSILIDGGIPTVFQPPMPDPCLPVTVKPHDDVRTTIRQDAAGHYTVFVSDLAGEYTLDVSTALGGCAWSLHADSTYPEWLHIVDGGGTESGTPRYTVDQNTSPLLPRIGTITASGPSFGAIEITVYQVEDAPPADNPVTCDQAYANAHPGQFISPTDNIPDDAGLQWCLDRGGVIVLNTGFPGYIVNGTSITVP